MLGSVKESQGDFIKKLVAQVWSATIGAWIYV